LAYPINFMLSVPPYEIKPPNTVKGRPVRPLLDLPVCEAAITLIWVHTDTSTSTCSSMG